MRFALSDEQLQLRDSVRRLLSDKASTHRLREVTQTPPGYDTDVWAQLTEQLGVHAITIPEQYGGAGFGQLELAVVLEEMGRALLPTPCFGTVVLAANALLNSGDREAMRDLLAPIATGGCLAALAWTEGAGDWGPGASTTRAKRSGIDWALSGHKTHVLDGHLADVVIVVAATDAGLSLFAVNGDDGGLTSRRMPSMDQTRPLSQLDFDNCRARLIGGDGEADRGLARTLDLAATALAAEQVGGARRCLEMAVDYAKSRNQFGQPIGSFQAIKHKCANMLLEIESAWAAAYYAAWVADTGSAEFPAAASIAKSYCSMAYTHAASENVQIHGGIGFTWEHDAHLYLKRAKSSELLLGDPAYHRAQLADRIGL